jgi:polyribonucleotide nucleotidyltransferase
MTTVVERELFGRKISIETGRIAKQAGGSVLVTCGDSVVLVAACGGQDKDVDFFPLTIDYVEKNYAAGKIPGGFFKREGKLSEKEILVSRLIDRPCRPLFPEGYSKEVQVIATVLSADEEVDTDILSIIGASAALTLSELPFEGPVAAVRVARIGGKLVINPPSSQLTKSDLSFVVAGTKDAIVMVEGGALEVPEADVLKALFFAHSEMQAVIQMQEELQKQVGKPKVAFTSRSIADGLPDGAEASLRKVLAPLVKEAVQTREKHLRREKLALAREKAKEAHQALLQEFPSAFSRTLGLVFEDEMYTSVRSRIIKEKARIDGRDLTTVRPISIEAGFLPRTHGSALFTRGETQAIVVATLGTEAEAQKLDNLIGETSKSFLLHYNFPPFSVGETRPVRGPGRREIGHGALAERAVRAVMPTLKEFPYVIRVVSEITESNGSSSMASVCGASLALMDAGVPLKAPVAGIAMGLIKEEGAFAVLSDILGDEDHLGDMDFKVCGTEKGITALQMDIKIKGLSEEVMSTALTQAREGRIHILEKMNGVLGSQRTSLSRFAPRIVSFKIPSDKIRELIGPGGKTIRSLCETCGVKIEVSDEGLVSISSNDQQKVNEARAIIESMTQQAEVGKIYHGIVKRIADFGAFVEIMPGTDGLVHISQLVEERVNRVTDVVQEGDEVWVKVLDIDRQGKIRLSMKEATAERSEQGLGA